MMDYRILRRAEIDRLADLDRTETIEAVYRVKQGELVLEPANLQVPDWSPAEKSQRIVALKASFDQGASFYGAWQRDRLVGMAVLGHQPLPDRKGRLQLIGLWVSHGIRGQGVGRALVQWAMGAAHQRGARSLYVSSTPSENSVRFYDSQGFQLAKPVDPKLYAKEPEDIHMELSLR